MLILNIWFFLILIKANWIILNEYKFFSSNLIFEKKFNPKYFSKSQLDITINIFHIKDMSEKT